MEGKKKKILLVDDDGTLRTLYTDLLESAGFEVEPAVEGKEGLEKAMQGGYDLILLDILLPGLQGTQVLEKLKQHPPQIPNGPILMLTNTDQTEILEKCKALGAAGTIIKSSVIPNQLTQYVRGYLNKEALNSTT